MQQQQQKKKKTWTISEIRDGEKVEVLTGATHEQALQAIRAAMYGSAEPLSARGEERVHELSLAA